MEKENKEKHKEVEGTVTPENKTKVKRSLLCFTLTPGLLYWSGGGGGSRLHTKTWRGTVQPNILTL